MSDSQVPAQTAMKLETQVREDGRIEVSVPLPQGARVTVFIVEEPQDHAADLVAAAQSSLGFWDNPFDDEDWNDA